jgi:hypothetical protein
MHLLVPKHRHAFGPTVIRSVLCADCEQAGLAFAPCWASDVCSNRQCQVHSPMAAKLHTILLECLREVAPECVREEPNAEDLLEKSTFAHPAARRSDLSLPRSRGNQLVYLPSQPPRGDALTCRASSSQRSFQSRAELCRSPHC